MEAADKKAIPLYPILLVNFIGTLGFSIVLPFLVTLVLKFGGNAVVYGVMGATYSAFQLVGAPILGRWSDVYGRRRILLLSQAGTLASWVVFLAALYLPATALANVNSTMLGKFVLTVPLVTVFAARALDGLTGGNVSVANAYLADITGEDDRKKNFGRMAIAANLGFILGPALAGLLGSTLYRELLPVLAALTISLVATVVIGFYLPESKPCALAMDPEPTNVRKVFGQEQKDCFQTASAKPIRLRDVLGLRHIPFLLFLNFLIFLAFNLFYASFPIHATNELGWSVKDLGIFFSFLGLTTVVAQGPILGFLGSRYSDGALTVAGGLVLGAGLTLLGGGEFAVIYAAATLFSLGNGLMWPSFLSLLSKAAPVEYQGTVQGISSSVGSLASIVGLVVGGIGYGLLKNGTFVLSGSIVLTVSVLSLRLLGMAKQNGKGGS